MHLVDLVRRPGSDEIEATTDFVERVADAIGRRPLSDHLWLDLQGGGSAGFHLVRVLDETGPLAIAQISGGNDAASLEVVVDPALPDDRARRVRHDVAATAVDAFRRSGGGRLQLWLDDPTDELLASAASLGLRPVRSLHEMRRSLPHERSADVATRAFRPGLDDDEWLAVNNRAFADHLEQGGWTAETLALRLTEPWFDADGFRIHERDGRIAAFCWTKIHDDVEPVLGEIYVIAVDPDFHGLGLGTQLTLAGLDSITAQGVTTAGLYVDADNTGAVSLYDRLGFTIHRTRTACAGDLAPLTPTPTPTENP